MIQPACHVLEATEEILRARQAIVQLACQQRAKFEGWLKFELAGALRDMSAFAAVVIEDPYATSGRCDLSFLYENRKWYVELKTANTNWRAPGLENLTRPITNNLEGIAADIVVLREKRGQAGGLAVFCIFPVPDRIWIQSREQLNAHLRNIERMAALPAETLTRSGDYIPATPDFGVCAWSVQVS